jgi:hypothetical protein
MKKLLSFIFLAALLVLAVMTTRVQDVTPYCPEGVERFKAVCLETTRLWKDSNKQ